MNKPSNAHSFRIIWAPFIATFLLIFLITTLAYKPSSGWAVFGFFVQSTTQTVIYSVFAYLIYRFGLSREKDDIKKLWISFGIVLAFFFTAALIGEFNLS